MLYPSVAGRLPKRFCRLHWGIFAKKHVAAHSSYDPKDFNDRMVLGLKGTMSELKLHLIRQRLDAGRMNKIMRHPEDPKGAFLVKISFLQ